MLGVTFCAKLAISGALRTHPLQDPKADVPGVVFIEVRQVSYRPCAEIARHEQAGLVNADSANRALRLKWVDSRSAGCFAIKCRYGGFGILMRMIFALGIGAVRK